MELPPFVEGPPPALAEEEGSPVVIYSDYFADLKDMLTDKFTEGDVGEDRGVTFHSDYVRRDNKRHIVFFLTHGPAEEARRITRITYVLPVNKDAAKIFKLEHAEPHVAPVYAEMTVPAGETADATISAHVASNNLASWHSEIGRVAALEQAAPVGKARRTYHNLVVYWRDMRTRLHDAIFGSPIHMPYTSSGHLRSSERRRRRSVSTARTDPGRRSSSRRATQRRKSSSDPRAASSPVRTRRRRIRTLSPLKSNSSERMHQKFRRAFRRKPTSDPE